MMTCFVALFDPQTKSLTYANASHNPPLHFHYQNEEVEKSQFHPLTNENGPRLGHKLDSSYQDTMIEIGAKDAIIFYTDGLLECTNPEGKAWGQRQFLKVLSQAILSSSAVVRDMVIDEANIFYQDKALNDDITFVVAKLNS